MISGSHDNWTGRMQLSPLDCFDSNGYINYVGKYMRMDRIVVKPMIFRKANTTISIYALGHIKDSVLNSAF